MERKHLGLTLMIVGIAGGVVMVAAMGFTLYQAVSVNERADDILVPVAAGLEDLDEQLGTVEELVSALIEVIPADTVISLAGTVDELTVRIETLNGYIAMARRAVVALDAVPFLPVDVAEIRELLEQLDDGLAAFTTSLGQLTNFILVNQDVPNELAEGVSTALAQLRLGLENARDEVVSVGNTVDQWLVLGTILTLLLLAWSVAGQVAIYLWGKSLRQAALAAPAN